MLHIFDGYFMCVMYRFKIIEYESIFMQNRADKGIVSK